MPWLVRLAILVLFFVTGFDFFFFVRGMASPVPLNMHTDAVVVWTGSRGRVARGVDVLKSGSAKRLLISGVSKSLSSLDLRQGFGISPFLLQCCVDLDRRAFNTRTNAYETVLWMRKHEYRSLRLVTSADHMPRAMLELERASNMKVTKRRTGNMGTTNGEIHLVPDAVFHARSLPQLLKEYCKYRLRVLIRIRNKVLDQVSADQVSGLLFFEA